MEMYRDLTCLYLINLDPKCRSGATEGIRQKDEERRDGEEQLGQWIPCRSIPFSLPPTRAVGDPCAGRVSHHPSISLPARLKLFRQG